MKERFAARIAEAYSQHSESYASVLEPTLQPIADEITDRAGLRGTERALDLATGTGYIARTLSRAGASVTGMDISLGMLAKARSLSPAGIPFVVGDAHNIPFRNQSFNLVTCGLSLTHFSRVAVALRGIFRVLRPEGQFISSAWGSEGQNPSKSAAVTVRKRFLEDRELTFAGEFGNDLWEDVSRGSDALRQAGFVDVRVTTMELSGTYRHSDEAIEAALAWPLTRYRIARLEAVERQKLLEETTAAILKVGDLSWRSDVHIYRALRPEERERV